MPQLSPLNWILLYILFWGLVVTLMLIQWWTFKPRFSAPKGCNLSSNQWPWC
uniref:ATP synthase F0 subunit 8 n=1 Tax=Ceraesignum maximum TaxID=1522080 RepID=E2FLR9_9CAEN|nr:ATP synthase F0 subunit 8 [Ceraesignum maximum]ADI79385.1 ATP synthase F0 subunit 8 [Ceraesignum maximum]